MDSKFEVFHCGYFPTLGGIFALVTGEETEKEIITEWFYLIKSKPNKVRGFVLRTSSVFASINEFWNSETYLNLKNALFYDELWPSIKDKINYHLYEKDIILNPIDKHSLFSIKAEHPGFIKYISKNTACSAFKDFEKLLKGIVIERKPIPYTEDEQ
jgi:hypothetical protein